MDFYAQIKKDGNADSHKLVIIGKITACIVVIIAAFWAPQIERFGSLLKYYQEMLSYISPPIVAVFILGIFSKRVNSNGAFCGLIIGTGIALVLLIFKPYIFPNVHFLIKVPFVFLASMAIVYTVSLFYPKPKEKQLKDTVFSSEILKKEIGVLKTGMFFKSYLFWSLLLLLCTAAIWITFG